MMKSKAFVFSGMGLLLVIPAIVLAASLVNMMGYGREATALAVSGDSVFYSCNNLISFLDTGARQGDRENALSFASSYANGTGLNFTYTALNQTYYRIILRTPSITCNKTIELRSGALLANLTLLSASYNLSTTYLGLMAYFRNATIPFTVKVTFYNGTTVTGANTTTIVLGANGTRTGLTNSSGIYYSNTIWIPNTTSNPGAFSSPFSDSGKCVRKEPLGTHTATTTATLFQYYDGDDKEQFKVMGNMSNAKVEGYKPTRTTLGLKITLKDEYGDPITLYSSTLSNQDESAGEGTNDCGTNYTSPLPTINATIYGGSTQASYTTNAGTINETGGSQNDKNLGVFLSTSGITFSVTQTYYANISASQVDYFSYNVSAVEISFTDFEATNVSYSPTTSSCDAKIGGGPGNNPHISLNLTNIGTSTGWNYTIFFKYCDTGAGCTEGNYSTYQTYYNNTYNYPTGKTGRGGNWIACSDNGAAIGGKKIFANITSVGSPNQDIDLTNNYVNGTA